MLVSIVILNWNGLSVLAPCLRSLADNTAVDGDYEIIVLDNGSQEQGIEDVVRPHPKVRLIKQAQNLGFAKGNNLAAREARGQFLVFLNNDTLPQQGWLQPLLDTFKRFPNCGLAGARIVNADGSVLHAGAYFVPAVREYVSAYRGFPGEIKELQSPRECEVYIACAILVERQTFERIGGFDEIYFQGYEDFDLCLKLRELGLTVRYCPDSVVVHFENTSMRKLDARTRKSARLANAAHFNDKWRRKFYRFRLAEQPGALGAFGDFSYYNNRRDSFFRFLPERLGKVLEAGCGAGVLGKRLKDEGKADYVCGIELSTHAAELAGKRIDKVIVGNLDTLPLRELQEQFDTLIFADVLEHLNNPWDVLHDLRAALCDGACVVASIPNIRYYKVIRQIVRDEWRYDPDGILDRTHLRFFSLSTIVDLFTLAGFEILEIGRETKSTRWSRLLAKFDKRVEDFVTIQYYVRARKLPDRSDAVGKLDRPQHRE